MKREFRLIERMLTSDASRAARAACDLAETPNGKTLIALAYDEAALPLRLIGNGMTSVSVLVVPNDGESRVAQITPGQYLLETASGQELWRRELRPQDVLLAFAQPNMPIQAAAQTDATDDTPTITELSAGRGLMIRVYAGREAGAIGIVLT